MPRSNVSLPPSKSAPTRFTGSRARRRRRRDTAFGNRQPSISIYLSNSRHDWRLCLFRHCEPTGRANARLITGSARQPRAVQQSADAWMIGLDRHKKALCFLECPRLPERYRRLPCRTGYRLAQLGCSACSASLDFSALWPKGFPAVASSADKSARSR